jgi:hypothetical protein
MRSPVNITTNATSTGSDLLRVAALRMVMTIVPGKRTISNLESVPAASSSSWFYSFEIGCPQVGQVEASVDSSLESSELVVIMGGVSFHTVHPDVSNSLDPHGTEPFV